MSSFVYNIKLKIQPKIISVSRLPFLDRQTLAVCSHYLRQDLKKVTDPEIERTLQTAFEDVIRQDAVQAFLESSDDFTGD